MAKIYKDELNDLARELASVEANELDIITEAEEKALNLLKPLSRGEVGDANGLVSELKELFAEAYGFDYDHLKKADVKKLEKRNEDNSFYQVFGWAFDTLKDGELEVVDLQAA